MVSLPVNKGLLAGIARRGGNRVIDRVVSDLMPADTVKPSIGKRIVGAALVRIASRSVPGAIIVGGGLLARAIHRKRQEERAKQAAKVVAQKPR
jgi:hypothetical protein